MPKRKDFDGVYMIEAVLQAPYEGNKFSYMLVQIQFHRPSCTAGYTVLETPLTAVQ